MDPKKIWEIEELCSCNTKRIARTILSLKKDKFLNTIKSISTKKKILYAIKVERAKCQIAKKYIQKGIKVESSLLGHDLPLCLVMPKELYRCESCPWIKFYPVNFRDFWEPPCKAYANHHRGSFFEFYPGEEDWVDNYLNILKELEKIAKEAE